MFFPGQFDLYLLTAIPVLLAAILGLVFWLGRLEWRIRKILGGADRQNLEKSLAENWRRIKSLENFENQAQNRLRLLDQRLQTSTRAIETLRYNPFVGTGSGGNQSFSAVWLNEQGDGLILTGLYLRDGTSLYAKPVKDFRSPHELTEEEQKVLERVKNALPSAN